MCPEPNSSNSLGNNIENTAFYSNPESNSSNRLGNHWENSLFYRIYPEQNSSNRLGNHIQNSVFYSIYPELNSSNRLENHSKNPVTRFNGTKNYKPKPIQNNQIMYHQTYQNHVKNHNSEVNDLTGYRVVETMINDGIFFDMLKNCMIFDTRVCHRFPYQSYKGTFIYQAYFRNDLKLFLKDYPPRRAEENAYYTENYMELNDHEISNIINFKTEIQDNQKCIRCRANFDVSKNGSTSCLYHFGKRIDLNGRVVFSCCDLDSKAPPCASCSFHIFNNIPADCAGPYYDFISTQNIGVHNKVYGMDCEMIYTSHGFEVARVSVVSSNYTALIDKYVRPEGKVYDLCTNISGIKQEDIANAQSLGDVRKELLSKISSNDILVGHGLENDLICLKMVHRNITDTSLLPWNGCNITDKNFKRPSLKDLAEKHLQIQIHQQGKSHNSIEDASVALQLATKFTFFK